MMEMQQSDIGFALLVVVCAVVLVRALRMLLESSATLHVSRSAAVAMRVRSSSSLAHGHFVLFSVS
jgi:hypothetical protein